MSKKIYVTILFLALSVIATAQDTLGVKAKNFGNETSVGKFLKSGDNQTAVSIVMSIVLTGIFLYLWRLDKKVNAALKNKDTSNL